MKTEYYNIVEAAKVMNVSETLVRGWIEKKSIEYIKTPSIILLDKTYIDNHKTTIFEKVTPNAKTK